MCFGHGSDEGREWGLGRVGKSKEGAGKSPAWTLGSACAQWAWAGEKGSRKRTIWDGREAETQMPMKTCGRDRGWLLLVLLRGLIGELSSYNWTFNHPFTKLFSTRPPMTSLPLNSMALSSMDLRPQTSMDRHLSVALSTVSFSFSN